jgi:transposase
VALGGKTVEDIASTVGCSISTVRTVICKSRLKPSTRGTYTSNIIKLINEGKMTRRQISEHLNCSLSIVDGTIHRYSLKYKPPAKNNK